MGVNWIMRGKPSKQELEEEKQKQLEQEQQMEQEYFDELEDIAKHNQNQVYKRILLTNNYTLNKTDKQFRLLYLWDGELVLCSTQDEITETISLENFISHEDLIDVARDDISDSNVKIELYTLLSNLLCVPIPSKLTNKYDQSSNLDEEIEDLTIGLIDEIADIYYSDGRYKENQLVNANETILNFLKDKYDSFREDYLGNVIRLIRIRLLGFKAKGSELLSAEAVYGANPVRALGRLLNEEYGVVLRRNIHTIYREDKKSKGYVQLTHDDLKELCAWIIGKNIVSDNDIRNALTVIDQRLTPEYNMIHFKNGIYDINKHELLDVDRSVFTLVETNFNYNPDAESKYLKYFLETSLEKSNKELTEKYKEGVLQVVGYLLTSGNPLNAIIFIVGIRGGGKSIFSQILTNIFNYDKTIDRVSNINLNELASSHGTSALENSIINISNDSPDKPLDEEAIALMKQISGNDNIFVNPKFRDPYTLLCTEVCKLLVVANHLGFFTELDEALISRIVLIEFEIMFRGTDREDKNLERKILENPEEMEWLIYNGLKAYERMRKNNEDFILRLSEEKTKELINKHSKPVNYLLKYLIQKHDIKAWEYETDDYNPAVDTESPYVKSDELSLNIIKLSIILGIDLKTNKNDKIDGRILSRAIKEEFDLFDFRYIGGEYAGSKYGSRVEKISVDYDNKTNTFKKQTIRHYPDLIKNYKLWIMLKKINLKDLRKRTNGVERDITEIQDYLAKISII